MHSAGPLKGHANCKQVSRSINLIGTHHHNLIVDQLTCQQQQERQRMMTIQRLDNRSSRSQRNSAATFNRVTQPKRGKEMRVDCKPKALIGGALVGLMLLLIATESISCLDAGGDSASLSSINHENDHHQAQRQRQNQKQTQMREDASELLSRSGDQSDENQSMATTKQPRQHFRLYLSPLAVAQSSSSSQFEKVFKNHRRRSPKLDKNDIHQTTSPDSSWPIMWPNNNNNDNNATQATDQYKKSPSHNNKKQISSLMLKKLLNQSLPNINSNSNNSLIQANSGSNAASPSSTGSKGSNFKFVFIQRATASPLNNYNNNNNQQQSMISPSKRKSGPTTLAPDNHSTQSLAASVSKQLASSLLQSAANLIGNNVNSSSLAPSISLLAARVAAAATPTTTTATSPQPPILTPTSDGVVGGGGMSFGRLYSANDEQSEAIKRLSIGSNDLNSGTTITKSAAKTNQNSSGQKKSRPSKIYNLPVKFVSNGQPSGVVLQTFKQHFATIKRLQSLSKASSSNKAAQANGKRAKDQLGKTKLTGTNSRLIYLPLMFQTNAKPNFITSSSSRKSHFHQHS